MVGLPITRIFSISFSLQQAKFVSDRFAIAVVSTILLTFSVTSSIGTATTVDVANGKALSQFQSASRQQIIEMAKKIAIAQLGPIEFEDFRRVTVQKRKHEFQIVFSAMVSVVQIKPESPLQSWISITITELGTQVIPQDAKYLPKLTPELRKVAALFAVDDSVSIKIGPDHYVASVSHPKSGGAEGYKIDKKTMKKEMTWHEHPDREDREEDRVSLDALGIEPWVEVAD